MSAGTLPARGVRQQIENWLRVDGRTKPQVYAQVFDAAELGSLNYWLELVFAVGIATFGLVLNSPAVIIGAMLVSPLMGPIMGMGLALAAGDLYLGLRSAVSLALSVGGSVALSAALVYALPFHSVTPEILARTNPNLLDLGVALLSGLAGSLVVCRGGSGGGVTALPGVAIAVALMPPLCTAGFGVGVGGDWDIISGAGLLFLTNLAAIVSSAFTVFFCVRMDAPAVRDEIDRYVQQRAESGRFSGILMRLRAGSRWHIGKLRWRVLMLAVVLGAVFIPLRAALEQVAREAVSRNAVQDALRGLAPADRLVSQQVRVRPEHISIRLIATSRIPQPKISDTKADIERRTGKRVDLTVEEVASRSELAELLDHLTAPLPAPAPKPAPVSEVRTELLERVRVPLQELWPPGAELLGYQFELGNAGTVLRIRYQSGLELGPFAQEMLQQSLRARLAAPELTLALDRTVPPCTQASPLKRPAR